MVKSLREQINFLEKEETVLALECRHMLSLIQGEKRRRHYHLGSTIPREIRDKVTNSWEQLILVFEEGLNQKNQELQSVRIRLILLQESLRRESGHGQK